MVRKPAPIDMEKPSDTMASSVIATTSSSSVKPRSSSASAARHRPTPLCCARRTPDLPSACSQPVPGVKIGTNRIKVERRIPNETGQWMACSVRDAQPVTNERDDVIAMLDHQRTLLCHTVDGLSDEQAGRRTTV